MQYEPDGYEDREFLPGARTRYLFYRCNNGHPITALQLEEAWAKAEKHNAENTSQHHAEVCPCGSRKISPGNPTLLEEWTRPSIWRLWFHRVFVPWLYRKVGV